MGHLQDMTPEQKNAFVALSYQRKKEANIGYNFEYFNQDKWDILESKGYQMWVFKGRFGDTEATQSIIHAKEIVEKLRSEGNYARIICGYIQTIQKVKHFTVIYKKK